jgi:hypothetical protein
MLPEEALVAPVSPPLGSAPGRQGLGSEFLGYGAVTGGVRIVVFVGKDNDDEAEDDQGQREIFILLKEEIITLR